jgi:hypothetical protein
VSSQPAKKIGNSRVARHVNKDMNVHMNVIYNKYEWYSMYCIHSKKQWCVLRNSRREKTLGEMWAAVIKDINNLLRTAWFRTRAPNGDRAGVSRCSEGDHAGHIREVPQEEYSPSKYMLNHVLILKRNCNLSTVYC